MNHGLSDDSTEILLSGKNIPEHENTTKGLWPCIVPKTIAAGFNGRQNRLVLRVNRLLIV